MSTARVEGHKTFHGETTRTPHEDAPRVRPCLRCRAEFRSEGFGDRICRRCKSRQSWRDGIPMRRGRSGRR